MASMTIICIDPNTQVPIAKEHLMLYAYLPALQGYKLMGEYHIEVYLPPEEGSEEMSVYIWVPLKKD